MNAEQKTALAEVMAFVPTRSMLEAKTAFWVHYKNAPLTDITKINKTMASQLGGTQSILKWWDTPGFKDWFLNEMAFAQKVEYLAALALEVAEQILLDPDAGAPAKVNLIKHLSELADKMPTKAKEIKWADKQIGDMTDEQLDEYIKKNKHLLIEGEKK